MRTLRHVTALQAKVIIQNDARQFVYHSVIRAKRAIAHTVEQRRARYVLGMLARQCWVRQHVADGRSVFYRIFTTRLADLVLGLGTLPEQLRRCCKRELLAFRLAPLLQVFQVAVIAHTDAIIELRLYFAQLLQFILQLLICLLHPLLCSDPNATACTASAAVLVYPQPKPRHTRQFIVSDIRIHFVVRSCLRCFEDGGLRLWHGWRLGRGRSWDRRRRLQRRWVLTRRQHRLIRYMPALRLISSLHLLRRTRRLLHVALLYLVMRSLLRAATLVRLCLLKPIDVYLLFDGLLVERGQRRSLQWPLLGTVRFRDRFHPLDLFCFVFGFQLKDISSLPSNRLIFNILPHRLRDELGIDSRVVPRVMNFEEQIARFLRSILLGHQTTIALRGVSAHFHVGRVAGQRLNHRALVFKVTQWIDRTAAPIHSLTSTLKLRILPSSL